jgi:hypothetical protein
MYGVFEYDLYSDWMVAYFESEEEAEDYMYDDERGDWWAYDAAEEGFFMRPVSQKEIEEFEADL